jgi:ureidoacrylate peracid hydrolase
MAILKMKGRYCKVNARAEKETDRVRYGEEEVKIKTEETAFLLVDVYLKDEEFIKVMRDRIKPVLEAARRTSLPVIYVNNSCPKIALSNSEFQKKIKQSLNNNMELSFNEDSIDPREYAYGHSGDLKIPEIIEPQPTDYFIRKHVYSGFYNTRLDTLLRNLGVKNLISVGYLTPVCLMTTLLDALYRNFKVILLRDCTLAAESSLEESKDILFSNNTTRSIRYVECFIGVTIASDDFIKAVDSTVKAR